MLPRALVGATCLALLGLMAWLWLGKQPQEAPAPTPAAPPALAVPSPGIDPEASGAVEPSPASAPGRLLGVVLDARRVPVAGARVRIVYEPAELGDELTSLTDTAGRFQADGLIEGQLVLEASAEGEFSRSLTLGLPVAEPVEIVLPARGVIRGLVVVETGVALSDVTVGAGVGGGTWEARTGPDGRYELAIPAGPISWIEASPLHRMSLRRPAGRSYLSGWWGIQEPSVGWADASGREIDFVFPLGASIQGLVGRWESGPATSRAPWASALPRACDRRRPSPPRRDARGSPRARCRARRPVG